jgi:hypothetical protein
MNRIVILLAASLAFIASGQTARTEDKPKDPLAALEKKLQGAWENGGACIGELTLRADSTFERSRYSPGNNKLSGTWEMRWNALPPRLMLTCKASDERDRHSVGKTVEYKVVQLDAETLALAYENAKEQDGLAARYALVQK